MGDVCCGTQPFYLAQVNTRIACDGDADALAGPHCTRVALRNFRLQSQWIHAHNINHRRAGREIFAGARTLLLHDAVQRCIDGRVTQLLARQSEFRSPLGHDGLAIANLLNRILVAANRNFVTGINRIKL